MDFFVEAVLFEAGRLLEMALTLVGDTGHGAPAFDFEVCLGQSVQTGLVKGAHLLNTIEEEPS